MEPIDMVLFCPACGLQHVDAPDWHNDPQLGAVRDQVPREASLKAPAHRSHLCRPEDGGCGHIWRPADVPTNGVQAVQTKGKADSPIAAPAGEHETPLQVIEAMRREDIERAPSYEELRELHRERRL